MKLRLVHRAEREVTMKRAELGLRLPTIMREGGPCVPRREMVLGA